MGSRASLLLRYDSLRSSLSFASLQMLSPFASAFAPLTTLPMAGGKWGVLGGKACFASRLPPRVHSEDRFLAEGPLEGPGAT